MQQKFKKDNTSETEVNRNIKEFHPFRMKILDFKPYLVEISRLLPFEISGGNARKASI